MARFVIPTISRDERRRPHSIRQCRDADHRIDDADRRPGNGFDGRQTVRQRSNSGQSGTRDSRMIEK
jgi:hypothetical protein